MKGMLFKPDIWAAKKKVLEEQGLAVTRRTAGLKEINQEPDKWVCRGAPYGIWQFDHKETGERVTAKPRYQVGETVYIKEAWCESYFGQPIHYKLDGGESPGPKGFWRSPLFLKAVNARTFLKIKDVRAERLQEITEDDCLLEGIERHTDSGNNIFWFEVAGDYHGDTQAAYPLESYAKLWDSINGEGDYALNKWVWRYEFEGGTG